MAERLVVIRHAKSDYPLGVADRDRPLNARGQRDALTAGVWLRDNSARLLQSPTTALVSSALRTQQTWERVGRHLTDVQTVVEPRLYNASMDEVIGCVGEWDAPTVIVVGHNPAMHDLVLQLAGPDPHGLLSGVSWKYPTCTIAALSLAPDDAFGWQSATLEALHTARA